MKDKLDKLKTAVDLVTKYMTGCGDNSCYFKTPQIGTNGGCRCLKSGAKPFVAQSLALLYKTALELVKEDGV